MGRFNIFYSWQSDLPREIAQDLIRAELKKSCTKVEEVYPQTDFVVDEATRGVPGSPNIPMTILKKIQMSEVFVCDLNPVAKTETGKAVANPNVLIELGFAVARLGWNRVILLFNEELGGLPADLPFDVDRHRVTRYAVRAADDMNGRGLLRKKLQDEIQLIHESSPCRPNEAPDPPKEEIERRRDLRELKSLLEVMPITILENGARELPDRFETDLNVCRLAFEATTESVLFHLSKSATMQLVQQLRDSWRAIDSYANYYFSNASGVPRFFVSSGLTDPKRHKKERAAYDALVDDRDFFLETLDAFVTHVREQYPELDLRETSEAGKQFLASLLPEGWLDPFKEPDE